MMNTLELQDFLQAKDPDPDPGDPKDRIQISKPGFYHCHIWVQKHCNCQLVHFCTWILFLCTLNIASGAKPRLGIISDNWYNIKVLSFYKVVKKLNIYNNLRNIHIYQAGSFCQLVLEMLRPACFTKSNKNVKKLFFFKYNRVTLLQVKSRFFLPLHKKSKRKNAG